MTVWLLLSHQHLFLLALFSWTLFCMELRLSTQLVFNVSSMQWLGLSCTSILVHLYCLQINFSNNSTGFLSNGVYGLNLHTRRPPYLPDLLQHHEPKEVSALIQFSSALSPPPQINIWISCFSFFCSESLEFITCQYSVTSYFQTSFKDNWLTVSPSPFSWTCCNA